jgi:regulator of sirC expression with transglutaminase-like and TPR domain
MLIEPAEINALIKLVDDPDEFIHVHVKEKIIDYGLDAIPYLDKVWNFDHSSESLKKELELIKHHIQFVNTKNLLKEWSESDEPDLLEGFILISRYKYPDISSEYVKKYLEKIKQDIWIELNPNLTAFEQIKVFNKVFFEIYGFRGNANNYHSPKNSFINTVLESKKGNPLSLSIIYMIIAQMLEFPLHGINLPNHFILGYVDEHLSRLTGNSKSNVVFYINPYSKGALLMNDDLERFLFELKLPLKDEFILPCDSKAIILRIINNLINAYLQDEQEDNVIELKEMKSLFPED